MNSSKTSKVFSEKTEPPKIILRKRKLHELSLHITGTSPEFYLHRMQRFGSKGLYRETMFGKEIIWNRYRYTFDDPNQKKKKNDPKKNLFIFSLVKRDGMKFIKETQVKKQKHLPPIHYNSRFNQLSVKIIGTDIDGAYWRIAFKKGLISENTFNHGLRIQDKQLCNAALANLGSDKSYRMIENGKFTSKILVLKGDDRLKEAYKMIRYKCFTLMQKLASLLGADYICYKTDCIYYAETPENVQKVKTFLYQHKMDFKMVHNFEKIKQEK